MKVWVALVGALAAGFVSVAMIRTSFVLFESFACASLGVSFLSACLPDVKWLEVSSEGKGMIVAVAAAVAEGKTRIYNAGRLRIKESDRLAAISDSLSALGADIRETEDGLEITGRAVLCGGQVSSFGDHRIAMSASVAALRCESEVTVENADAVSKSYPSFFEDMASLGLTVKKR